MAAIVHLEPKEFIEKLFETQTTLEAHPYILENRIAAMVYMFTGKDDNTYYLDRPFAAKSLEGYDPINIHADLYRKVALDVSLRK